MGKKLIAVLIVAIVVVIAYFAFGKNIFGISFEGGFAQIKEIDVKYGTGEGALIPEDRSETSNYMNALEGLRAGFGSAPESREKSALLLLINSKVSASFAQMSIIAGSEDYRRISKVSYECGEGETARVAGINFEKAVENAERALSLHSTFIENYADFAKTAEISETDTDALALKALSESAEELIKYIDAYCNISG